MNSKNSTKQLLRKITALQNELILINRKFNDLKIKKRHLETENNYRIKIHQNMSQISETKEGLKNFMLRIMYGKIAIEKLHNIVTFKIDKPELTKLYDAAVHEPPAVRKKALAMLYHLCGISQRSIIDFLFMGRNTMKRYIRKFAEKGVEEFLNRCHKNLKVVENSLYKEKIISTIHTPPAEFGFNRTSWTTKLLKTALESQGISIGKNNISKIIKRAGYRFWKAKEVLTSNDPSYREKLDAIKKILSNLRPKDRFFSIDEFGPFAVKERGGRRLVRKNEHPTVPQFQRSKGCIIFTAALELSTNQMTHFYSGKKNSSEMIKMIHVLRRKYVGCRKIYLSWDHASWHSSKILFDEILKMNKCKHGKRWNFPLVKTAPLPARSQFLNVIESVFSGMATAIIHNSNYSSVEAAKNAIDRYIKERNEYFHKYPKRAGDKIWGKELVPATFKEGQNCKNPKWR